MAFTAVEGYKGYIVFVWSYGIFLGGYQYCLKMYIYEKVRARNFARALGFAQSSTAIPTLVSIPLLSKYLLIDLYPAFSKLLHHKSNCIIEPFEHVRGTTPSLASRLAMT
jgi:hypothetical protein